MRQQRRFFRPCVDILERRDTPSNFTVTLNDFSHTLDIVGGGPNDKITIEGNAGDATMFALSSPGGDTFNNKPTYNSPTGAQNIMMTLPGGNTVFFDDAVTPINLRGSLTINGGAGDNLFTAIDMSVAKNVTINNASGGSNTDIKRDAAGFSFIGGNVSITNGAGVDQTVIADTNLGGNVTVNNGPGDALGNAGFMQIDNIKNKTVRSLIKGNVSISFLTGNMSVTDDAILDAEVKGSVAIAYGNGAFTTNFDGLSVPQPALIVGNLSITGSGSNTVNVGTTNAGTGLIVGGNFTVTTPATKLSHNPVGALNFTNLQVGLATSLGLGDGSDSVTIKTSTFLGPFTLTTGAGNDTVGMTTVDAIGSLTINSGSGANTVTATNLQVGGNLAISSANLTAANLMKSTFTDLTVNGSVTINNGNGDTITTLQRDAVGFNTIGGNLSITNAIGADDDFISDTNIGGSVTVNNGNGDASGDAGHLEILSSKNLGVRSEIKGNLSISNLTGDVLSEQDILDTEIDGNVMIANGSGTFITDFDGLNSHLPVIIHGNLSITGSGSDTVDVGTVYNNTGLIVGGSFTIATPPTKNPSPPAGTLNFAKLQVGLATNLGLGGGADSVTINASEFVGPFTLTTGAGDDSVTMTTVEAHGSLTFNLGSGANTLSATNLQVGGNLAVSSANTTAANLMKSTFTDLTVNGSVSINNGNGDTITTVERDAVGFNTIGGNLSITNAIGADDDFISDTNIGGSVTVNNGNGDASGDAGHLEIFSFRNHGVRSEIKGNLSISNLTGDVLSEQDILDTEIDGNVMIANGSGTFITAFDGLNSNLPVIIHGNLSVTGSGSDSVEVGTVYNNTGLIVGGSFTIATPPTKNPSPPAGTLTFSKLQVTGNTSITLGNGNDVVTIDDSTFHGAFTLTTGAGADQVNLETTAATTAPTIFTGPVLINLGAADDTLTREGNADAFQELFILDTFVVHHGTGGDSVTTFPGKEFFPFMTVPQWLI